MRKISLSCSLLAALSLGLVSLGSGCAQQSTMGTNAPAPKKTAGASTLGGGAEVPMGSDAPVAAPAATPETPAATPETPTATPETPAATPETPAATPEAPAATPEAAAPATEEAKPAEPAPTEPKPEN